MKYGGQIISTKRNKPLWFTAQQLTDLVDLYKDDLPSPQLFSSEFQRWKIMVQNGRIAADSCPSSLKACDPDDFPNLHMLLKIAATLPVTACECERSVSKMRRLNNCMRWWEWWNGVMGMGWGDGGWNGVMGDRMGWGDGPWERVGSSPWL